MSESLTGRLKFFTHQYLEKLSKILILVISYVFAREQGDKGVT